MHRLLKPFSNKRCECWPWWLYVYNLFPRFKMWYILTSSKYTWSWKQIPEVEWDTQEQTQPLELPHRLAHFFARSHHCHQALAMINNATMIHWQIELCYGHLPIQFWWPRHWGYSFSCKMVVEWQIYVQPWLHFLSLRWMSEGQENILLDNRALIQIWIWWWRNCNQNCRSLKQDHNCLPWIKRYGLCACEAQFHPSCLKRYTTQPELWCSVDAGKKLG